MVVPERGRRRRLALGVPRRPRHRRAVPARIRRLGHRRARVPPRRVVLAQPHPRRPRRRGLRRERTAPRPALRRRRPPGHGLDRRQPRRHPRGRPHPVLVRRDRGADPGCRRRRRHAHPGRPRRGRPARPDPAPRQAGLARGTARHLVPPHHRHLADRVARGRAARLRRVPAVDEPRPGHRAPDGPLRRHPVRRRAPARRGPLARARRAPGHGRVDDRRHGDRVRRRRPDLPPGERTGAGRAVLDAGHPAAGRRDRHAARPRRHPDRRRLVVLRRPDRGRRRDPPSC